MKDPSLTWEEYAKNLEATTSHTDKRLKEFEDRFQVLKNELHAKTCKLVLKQAEVFEFAGIEGIIKLAQAMTLTSEISTLAERIPALWDDMMNGDDDKCPF